MNRVIKFSLINAMRVRKVLKRGRSIINTARQQLGAVHMSCPMARPRKVIGKVEGVVEGISKGRSTRAYCYQDDSNQ